MNVSSTNQKQKSVALSLLPPLGAQVLPAGHDAIIAMDEMSTTPLPKVPSKGTVAFTASTKRRLFNDIWHVQMMESIHLWYIFDTNPWNKRNPSSQDLNVVWKVWLWTFSNLKHHFDLSNGVSFLHSSEFYFWKWNSECYTFCFIYLRCFIKQINKMCLRQPDINHTHMNQYDRMGFFCIWIYPGVMKIY